MYTGKLKMNTNRFLSINIKYLNFYHQVVLKLCTGNVKLKKVVYYLKLIQ